MLKRMTVTLIASAAVFGVAMAEEAGVHVGRWCGA